MTRIVAGSLKGRIIEGRPSGRLRPTGIRMREAMFSVLGDACHDEQVLDLFAGTGALGFEALSRDARFVTFVDNDRATCRRLLQNAQKLGVADKCRVVCKDVFSFLHRLPADSLQFGLIFADPPFEQQLCQKVFGWWHSVAGAAELLVMEYPSRQEAPGLALGVQPAKSSKFGESAYDVYLAPAGAEEQQ